ncbi:MAG TPA: hypothetical protein VJR92_12025 [Gemmatimonadaceae bacterium]|nr:hypothetical protein [Gemmatimonadaceae bacterium]
MSKTAERADSVAADDRVAGARRGFALEATLIIMVLISALILASLSGVVSQQRVNTTDLANMQALYVAEGGADAVMAQLNTFMGDGNLSDAELALITTPTVSGWTFAPVAATKIGPQVVRTITDGDFAGLVSYNQEIDLRVAATNPAGDRGEVVITANAQAVPVYQFGVFYDKDLEIHPGAQMTLEGWVHSNSKIYVSSGALTFLSQVTSTDSLVFQRKSHNERIAGVRIANNAGTPIVLTFDNRGTTYTQFIDYSQSIFDSRVRSIAHGVPGLRLPLPAGSPASTLTRPRSAADNNQVKGVKYSWKADLVLRVNMALAGTTGSNMYRHDQPGHICNSQGGYGTNPSDPINGSGNINATWQRDSSSFSALPDSLTCKSIFKWNPGSAAAASPALERTQFRDGRENIRVYSLDIDMAQLRAWVNASWASRHPKIIYVEFYNVPAGYYPAVRIINGSQLPGAEPTPTPRAPYGLTIATHAPVYVKGDFNYVAANPTYWKPAAIVSDAIIFQSPAWNDNTNGGNYGNNAAVQLAAGGFANPNTMNVYAAVSAGHTATTCDWQTAGCSGVYPANYGGGLESFPRFLENWSSANHVFRGSLTSFYESQQANLRTWSQGTAFYSAPVRDWRFDLRLQDTNNMPPGTPVVGTVLQLAYRPVY